VNDGNDLRALGKAGPGSRGSRAVGHGGTSARHSWIACPEGTAGGAISMGHGALHPGHPGVVEAERGGDQGLHLEQESEGREETHDPEASRRATECPAPEHSGEGPGQQTSMGPRKSPCTPAQPGLNCRQPRSELPQHHPVPGISSFPAVKHQRRERRPAHPFWLLPRLSAVPTPRPLKELLGVAGRVCRAGIPARSSNGAHSSGGRRTGARGQNGACVRD
jgi:hypothetical protein